MTNMFLIETTSENSSLSISSLVNARDRHNKGKNEQNKRPLQVCFSSIIHDATTALLLSSNFLFKLVNSISFSSFLSNNSLNL